jgi:drug/metabolite transporter (DMT)-like permease
LSQEENRRPAFPWLAIGALVAVNALWGFSFPVVKAVNEIFDARFGISHSGESSIFRAIVASWMVGVRFSLAFVLIVLCCYSLTRRATRSEWIAGFWIGIFFFAGLVLQIFGLATIPASRSGFLTSLTTIFTPLLSAMWFRRMPARTMTAGALIALGGVAVLTGLLEIDSGGIRLAADAHQRWTLGDSLTTLGSFFFSFQVLLLDYYGRRLNTVAVTPSMFLTTAVLGWLSVALILGTPLRLGAGVTGMSIGTLTSITMDPIFLVSMLLLAFFCSLLSFGWMNRFQPYVTATQAAVIYSLEPVFASSWALFLPGLLSMATGIVHPNEELTWSLWMGGILILVANVVALWPTKKIKLIQ